MGQLADAFVEFLSAVHSASVKTGGAKQKAEQEVTDAAKSVMSLYIAYTPADPEDVYDASAVKLIEKVKDTEILAALVVTK